jgi:AcrR family transcriptional regulator
MARKTAKTYHHGDLRGALVAAGRHILEKEGREALTLRACARHAGVSHAAPQHHFSSVAQLLAEIAASGFVDFVEALGEAAAGKEGPAKRLKAMGAAYVVFARQHPALYQLMFGVMLTEKSASLQQAMTAAWDQLAEAVASVTGGKNISSGAIHVWSLVHGFSMLAISGKMPAGIDGDAALDDMLQGLPKAISSLPE